MPPKRNVKNNSKPKPLIQLTDSNSGLSAEESTDAELKFDQEVLWCISQFEKNLATGKLPEPKSQFKNHASPTTLLPIFLLPTGQEIIKAINTLRKPGVAKIKKIQLMQQFFKDYKSKMMKEETEQVVNFKPEALNETNKGIFVKRKIQVENSQENCSKSSASTGFMFNFKDPSEDQDISKVTKSVNSIKLS